MSHFLPIIAATAAAGTVAGLDMSGLNEARQYGDPRGLHAMHPPPVLGSPRKEVALSAARFAILTAGFSAAQVVLGETDPRRIVTRAAVGAMLSESTTMAIRLAHTLAEERPDAADFRAFVGAQNYVARYGVGVLRR